MTRALVPLMFAAALGACVADNGDEGIFITKNVVPEDGCTFAASATSPFLSRGQLSAFSPNAYAFHPQMKSRILAAEGQEDQRTVIMRGARIDIEIVDRDLLASMGGATALEVAGITRFESAFTAPIAPNGGITDASFDLIPRRVVDEIAAANPAARTPGSGFQTELIASVVVYGDLAGAEVTSQSFKYPVTVCTDCIINVVGVCPLPSGTDVRPGNSCNPFQDGVVDCCENAGSVLCPAPTATAAN